jgi:hypothetical protein
MRWSAVRFLCKKYLEAPRSDFDDLVYAKRLDKLPVH